MAEERANMCSMEPVTYIWMDGQLIAWEDATVHVLSHALHYGTGVFEGIRAYETESGPAVSMTQESSSSVAGLWS